MIKTKYTMDVVEYDSSGYYHQLYPTRQVVIAESWKEAERIAIERTPKKHSEYDWKQFVDLIEAEDIVVDSHE